MTTFLPYFVLLLFSKSISAQGNIGVFSPVVKTGHHTIDYRVAIDSDAEIDNTAFVKRLHYQASVNRDFMWHVIAQNRKRNDLAYDFNYVQVQLIWDRGEDNQKWRTGLRFDVRVHDGDKANQLGFNWMGQYQFDNS